MNSLLSVCYFIRIARGGNNLTAFNFSDDFACWLIVVDAVNVEILLNLKFVNEVRDIRTLTQPTYNRY